MLEAFKRIYNAFKKSSSAFFMYCNYIECIPSFFCNDKLTNRSKVHTKRCGGLYLFPAIKSYTFFFITFNTFISYTRLKLAENQAKAKQHLVSELLLSENYSFCSSTSSYTK